MFKALNLPKGAKEELNYPPEVVDKIQKGLPLWNEEGEDEENTENQEDDEKKLTEDQKMLITLFGEGKFHLIPSFFRTLIYLKK